VIPGPKPGISIRIAKKLLLAVFLFIFLEGYNLDALILAMMMSF